MPPSRRKRPTEGPFADKIIGPRINALRVERGFSAKAFYEEMDWEKGEHSRKVRGLTPIWGGEAGRAARILRAPRGWPYITVEEGMLLDALGDRAAQVLQHFGEILEMLHARNR